MNHEEIVGHRRIIIRTSVLRIFCGVVIFPKKKMPQVQDKKTSNHIDIIFLPNVHRTLLFLGSPNVLFCVEDVHACIPGIVFPQQAGVIKTKV